MGCGYERNEQREQRGDDRERAHPPHVSEGSPSFESNVGTSRSYLHVA